MSAYYFIENKNPTSDPNIDLNFDNDLLFSDIIADDYDKYKGSNVINENIPPHQPAKNQPLYKQTLKPQNNANIYVIFIIIVIILLFLWYIYSSSKKSSNNPSFNKNLIESPDLVMLSPDFGNGMRFGLNF